MIKEMITAMADKQTKPKMNREKFLRFEGSLSPGSVNAEERTCSVVWYTGARVERYSWSEGRYMLELSMEPDAVDISRLTSGTAPLLNAHSDYSLSDVIGVIENARIENGIGYATVRFSQREEVEPIFRDVQDGILCNISMGARIEALELLEAQSGELKVYRATKWSVEELSIVPVGADSAAHILAHETGEGDPLEKLINGGVNMEEMKKDVQTPAPAAEPQPNAAELARQAAAEERGRVTEILALCKRHCMTEDFASAYVEGGNSVEDVRAAILDKLAAQAPSVSNISVGVTDEEKQRLSLQNAILARVSPQKYNEDANGSRYRGRSLIEMARLYMENHGAKLDGFSAIQIAQLALTGRTAMGGMMTTGDMPLVLGNTIARRLRDEYLEMAPTWPQFCRRATAVDFKEMTVVSLAGDVAFRDVPESGEYEHGSMLESAEKYKLSKSGRIISLSFEMMVNDDLGAFGRIPQMIASAARAKEANVIYGILNDNPNMSDEKALFSTDHKNLASTAGVPSEATLSAACVAMFEQTNLAGDPINVKPKFLIHGPQNLVTVKKMLSTDMLATKSGDINVFKGEFVPVLDQRITDKRWFLLSDPAMCDTIEYAYLDGMEGVTTETQYGFDVDGVAVKARMIFGAKAIDYRGMYKNAGA